MGVLSNRPTVHTPERWGLTPAAETLDPTVGHIHGGPRPSTEAHRSLRRGLALSTFGFLCLFLKYKKINFNPGVFMSPHPEIGHAQLWRAIYSMLLPGRHLARFLSSHTKGTSLTTPSLSIQVPQRNLLFPSADGSSMLQFPGQSRDMKGSITTASPTGVGLASAALQQPHQQGLGLACATLLSDDPGAQYCSFPLLLSESGYGIPERVT